MLVRLRVSKLRGPDRTYGLLKYDDGEAPNLKALNEAADAIAEEFDWRRTMASDDWSPKNANAWLRKVAYDLIGFALDSGCFERFTDRIRLARRSLRGVKGNPTPFQKGLLALFANAQGVELKSNERNLMGAQLWHAYRHFVPGEFLEGFLSQCTTHGIIERSAREEIEPGFDDWIADHLGKAKNFRGHRKYPKRIARDAKETRNSEQFKNAFILTIADENAGQ